MYKSIVRILVLFIFALNAFAAETYYLDSEHTSVLWRIKHLGFSDQSGKWYAKGILALDKGKPENSKVSAVIQISEVITGIPELDKYLRSAMFFDTEKYPTATFVSHRVNMLDKDTAKVMGRLTLHGVTKPVILDVKLNQMNRNPITKKMVASFSATANIRRSDFGITTIVPALGDDVYLNIEAEGERRDG